MAKDFTAKDAKQLIAYHNALLSDLDYVEAKDAEMRSKIKEAATKAVTYGTLKRAITKDCSGSSSSVKIDDFEQIISALSKYRCALPTIEKAKRVNSSTGNEVRQKLISLKPAALGISWLFSGKQKKAAAIQAYNELTELKVGDYAETAPELKRQADIADELPAAAATELYRDSPNELAAVLDKANIGTIEVSANNAPFVQLLGRADGIDKKVAACQHITGEYEERIKNAAKVLAAYSALQILQGVPIEELNRNKAGFRVKTLRDSGFTTIADICLTSAYKLKALDGISAEAALSIKRTADEFLENAQDGVKIKLSADDQNKYATELVKIICEYLAKKSSKKELDELVNANKKRLTNATDELKAVGNGLKWLFYSPEKRQSVRTAYADISSAVSGDYAAAIKRLTDAITAEVRHPSVNAAWNDFQSNSVAYFSVLEAVIPELLGNSDSLYGLPEELAREIQSECLSLSGLRCQLRRYQEWGVKYILRQKRVLLGDEMGLGKTIQAIAAMVSLRNAGATHFMVVCPASVITNWCREIVKHSELNATKIHGADRIEALEAWKEAGGVAVTTYETTEYICDALTHTVDMLTVDEAHYIKNPNAQRTINVKSLCERADRLLFMTGTALENRADEMVALIDILNPEVANSVRDISFMSAAPQFRLKVAPVYYRRKRADVLTELPELTESKEWCVLKSEEKRIYEENVLAKNYPAARRLSWDIGELKKSCKASRLMEIIEEAREEERKVLIFSFFLKTIETIREYIPDNCFGPITGSVTPQKRQEIIDEFDRAPSGAVLLAQIQSGGTGLNIQSASVVVICEPQFKPSIENQAISRAYRMGQSRNVLVYRLLCEDTVDERITELLEQKQRIFDEFADKSVAAEQSEAIEKEAEIDEKNFGQIIGEEIDRINAQRAAEKQDNAQ